MRSKTALSLAELCLALDGDPWMFAGIDRYGEVKSLSQEVRITLEEPWMTKASANNSTPAGSNSRSVVRKALASAERRFVEVCYKYPIPTQVSQEKHDVQSYRRTQRTGFVVKPRYTPNIQFGVPGKTKVGDDIPLTKESPALLDEFSCTTNVPDDTFADDVHVYLTSTDGNYSGEPALQHEIRPVDVTIDSTGGTGNWIATISIPAYVCVKPSLYKNQKTALLHETATYIDDVHVWVDSLDICQQGFFRSKTQSSSLLTNEDVAAGMYDRGNDYFIAEPITCQNTVIRSTVMNKYPDSIFLNYVSGFARENGRVHEAVADVLSKLTPGYLRFDEERVESENNFLSSPLWTGKAQYYREMQTYEKRSDQLGAQTSVEYALDVKPEIQYMMNGLESRRGPIQAYGDMLQYGWVNPYVNRTIK